MNSTLIKIKLLFLSFILLVTTSSIAEKLPFDTDLTHFNRNANVIVKACYRSGWCKIENGNYIKRYDIEKKRGRVYKIRKENKAEAYIRSSKLKKNKRLWRYIKKVVKKNKIHYKYHKSGYTPVSVVKRYYDAKGQKNRYKKKESYNKDEIVVITKHYNSGMSRLDNGTYIKRSQITRVPYSLYKVRKRVAFVFIKNKLFKHDEEMYAYAKNYAYKKASTKKDFQRGYTEVKPIKNRTQDTNQFVDGLILMASAGKSNTAIDTDIEKALWVDDELDEASGNIVDIGAGVVLNKNLTATGNIQHTKQGLAKITNLYAGINYITSGETIRFKIGAIAGVSMLKWSEAPLEFARDNYKDIKQEAVLYGVQVGILFGFSDNLDMTLKAQGLMLNQTLEVKDTQNTLEHGLQTNIMVGLRYKI